VKEVISAFLIRAGGEGLAETNIHQEDSKMKKTALIAIVVIVFVGLGTIAIQEAEGAKTIRWKLQGPFPAGMSITYGATEFAKKVEAMSGGRLKVKAFPGGAVVPPLKEFDAVKKGTLDAHFSATHYHTSQVGLAGDLFNLYPGGPSPMEFAVWVYEGGGLALWQELYDRHNYPVVALGPMGYTSAELFGWFKKPIESLEDFKGMKFRTAGIWGEILTELGAAVVQLPGGEIFESMKRGVLDAFEFSTPGVDFSTGFHQLGAYMVGPGIHAPMSAFELLVNKNSWEELTPDLQAIVRTAAEATSLRMLCYIDHDDVLAMDKLKEYGVKFHKLPDEVQKEVVKKANELYDRKAKEDPFFDKVLNHQRAFLKKYRAYKDFCQPDPNLMQTD
jgi:TRAP-type mannitol/chloroaromatic compound transport system substrate-binding protein